MMPRLFTLFLVLAISKAFAQQCTGDACEIITVKQNPTNTIAWRFTNTSDRPVKIGLKLDLGGCSSISYYAVAPHQPLNWGIGMQDFCLPFEASFANKGDFKTKTVPVTGRAAGSPPPS